MSIAMEGVNHAGVGLFGASILERAQLLVDEVSAQPDEIKIALINELRKILHEASPFRGEPVDCVLWIRSEEVQANDYNPNTVAPPEMRLLELSILEDGYTQPVVTWLRDDGAREVVDGFHRNRVARESKQVSKRLGGYIPVTTTNAARSDRGDRIAATIRHNRARGKHRVQAMSDIVVELRRRNWSEERIAKELGMDPDEVLRLCQVSGLSELFANQQFSQAWEIAHSNGAANIGDDLMPETSDEDPQVNGRILHTWDKWECYRHGFYAENPPDGLSLLEGEEKYREFLADPERFENALKVVTTQWTHSCEHYLTNERMNRIAWLGQAAAAQAMRMPTCCRGGYHGLSGEQQRAADSLALRYLNDWLVLHGREEIPPEEAAGKTMMDLY